MTRIPAVFPAAALFAMLTAGAQAQSPPTPASAPPPNTPAASSCETTGTSASTDANVAKPTVEPEGNAGAARTPVPNQPNTTATNAHTDCVRPAPSPNRG
jgi:hypothetical protein